MSPGITTKYPKPYGNLGGKPPSEPYPGISCDPSLHDRRAGPRFLHLYTQIMTPCQAAPHQTLVQFLAESYPAISLRPRNPRFASADLPRADDGLTLNVHCVDQVLDLAPRFASWGFSHWMKLRPFNQFMLRTLLVHHITRHYTGVQGKSIRDIRSSLKAGRSLGPRVCDSWCKGWIMLNHQGKG